MKETTQRYNEVKQSIKYILTKLNNQYSLDIKDHIDILASRVMEDIKHIQYRNNAIDKVLNKLK